jgi:hypothetical protein
VEAAAGDTSAALEALDAFVHATEGTLRASCKHGVASPLQSSAGHEGAGRCNAAAAERASARGREPLWDVWTLLRTQLRAGVDTVEAAKLTPNAVEPVRAPISALGKEPPATLQLGRREL